MPKKEQRIIYGAIAILFVCFLGFPLILLLANMFATGEEGLFSNISYVVTQKEFFSSLGNSFLISGVSGLVTTVLAFVMAYTVNYTNIPKWLRSFIIVMVAVPMLFPTITYGFAIIYSFGKQGLITGFLGKQLLDIYGFNGLLLGYVAYTLPTAFLLLHNTFKYIDKKYLTVSQLMGDSPTKCFMVTTFRPMIATICTAMIQAFFLCFTDYGIPAAVGGEFNVIATTLYNQMLGASPNFGRGAVVAMMMLLPSVLSIIIQHRLDKTNFRYSKISQVELPKNPLRDILLGTFSTGTLLAVLSIFAVVFVIPFVRQWPYDKTASFSTFFIRIEGSNITGTLVNSITVSLITAVIGSVLVYACGLISQRSSGGTRLR
ncbi:MAG: ABC transporter permease subunit, partial [Anaerovoracaceae bacterium]